MRSARLKEERERNSALLAAGQYGEAVATFLSDIMPLPALAELRASPASALFEAHAPTLAYDYTILGDGEPPTAIAQAVVIPVLLICAL